MAGALQGVRVADFTRMLAGPFCTEILSEMGAEVIKVEFRGSGDALRTLPPLTEAGEGYFFMSVNRGKKSVTLDVRSPEGKELVNKLLKRSDVMVENFAPGVMKKLGLDYESAKKINPRIIYASISGFGQDGPNSHRLAFDMVGQAMGGMMSVTGFGGNPPTKCGPSIADMSGGLYATIGVLAALHHRDMTGEGQYMDISMQDSVWAMTAPEAAGTYFLEGKIPSGMGNLHPSIVPWNTYKARDGYVAICILTVGHWQAFAELMGRNDLVKDPDSLVMTERLKKRDFLHGIIDEWVKDMTVAEVLKLMEKADLPAAPVMNVEQIVNDPHIQHRDMIVEVEQLLSGPVKLPGSVIKMSGTPCDPYVPSPFLGQHNSEVYSELLGLNEETLDAYMEKGII